MRRALLIAALSTGAIGPAHAYDFEPLKPLDVQSVDKALLNDIYGAWEIRDKSGKRRCRIELQKGAAIGGYAIAVAPDCAKAFPVMDDIGAWRLQENWTIDLVDALRKTRVRFETPDNRNVALGDKADIAGMAELVKLPPSKPAKK